MAFLDRNPLPSYVLRSAAGRAARSFALFWRASRSPSSDVQLCLRRSPRHDQGSEMPVHCGFGVRWMSNPMPLVQNPASEGMS